MTIILYVGRVSYEKNLQLVIDTYKHMDYSKCHLVVVGDGPALVSVKHSCALLPVTFTGYLYGSDLATAYASADFFAFASNTETFGQVVLEAMASGLPVSGLMAEGVRDLIQHEYSGLLLDTSTTSCNTESLWQAYKQHWDFLIGSPDHRMEMGKRAREIATTFTWDSAMEHLVDTYKDAIKDSAATDG
jgi:glycosyltransferase involved in cell wall biosynthesis